MPKVMRREDVASSQKSGAAGSAVVKSRSAEAGESGPRLQIIVAIAGVLALALIAFLFRAYVVGPPQSRTPTKVAPLPGFSDSFPYNTKEWQEAYKQGRAGMISGVPHAPMGAAPGTTAGAPGGPN